MVLLNLVPVVPQLLVGIGKYTLILENPSFVGAAGPDRVLNLVCLQA
eukprot:SAG11_NODE_35418_length_266_cov_1.544910_1_plen_46_part_01